MKTVKGKLICYLSAVRILAFCTITILIPKMGNRWHRRFGLVLNIDQGGFEIHC